MNFQKYPILPIAMLGLIALLKVLSTFAILPSPSSILTIVSSFIEQHGTIVVAPVSFLENLAGLNVYFPGSIAILATMAQTAGNPQKAFITYLAIYLPALIAYHFNILLTKQRERSRTTSKLSAANPRSIWVRCLLTFWHPHLASLTTIYLASSGFSYASFIVPVLVISLLWHTFWGLAMYLFGLVISDAAFSLDWVVIAYLLVWILASEPIRGKLLLVFRKKN